MVKLCCATVSTAGEFEGPVGEEPFSKMQEPEVWPIITVWQSHWQLCEDLHIMPEDQLKRVPPGGCLQMHLIGPALQGPCADALALRLHLGVGQVTVRLQGCCSCTCKVHMRHEGFQKRSQMGAYG